RAATPGRRPPTSPAPVQRGRRPAAACRCPSYPSSLQTFFIAHRLRQLPSPARQVPSHGDRRHAEQRGDVANGGAFELEEDDDRPAPRPEGIERPPHRGPSDQLAL